MNLKYDRSFIAIDYGERRIGLAKSDPTGTIASALKTIEIKSQKEALEKVLGVIKEYEPNGLVIGYPYLPSGDKSEKCIQIDKFVIKLEEMIICSNLQSSALGKLPIHKVDERYSSIEATGIIHAHGKKIGQDKKRIDRLAAVVILQRFLDEGLA